VTTATDLCRSLKHPFPLMEKGHTAFRHWFKQALHPSLKSDLSATSARGKAMNKDYSKYCWIQGWVSNWPNLVQKLQRNRCNSGNWYMVPQRPTVDFVPCAHFETDTRAQKNRVFKHTRHPSYFLQKNNTEYRPYGRIMRRFINAMVLRKQEFAHFTFYVKFTKTVQVSRPTDKIELPQTPVQFLEIYAVLAHALPKTYRWKVVARRFTEGRHGHKNPYASRTELQA
jgi:hypothetical protein